MYNSSTSSMSQHNGGGSFSLEIKSDCSCGDIIEECLNDGNDCEAGTKKVDGACGDCAAGT